MAVRSIDANALADIIDAWPEPVIYKDWVQSAIANAPTLTEKQGRPIDANELHRLITAYPGSVLYKGDVMREILYMPTLTNW